MGSSKFFGSLIANFKIKIKKLKLKLKLKLLHHIGSAILNFENLRLFVINIPENPRITSHWNQAIFRLFARHFEFFNFDFKFVISDPKNLSDFIFG